MSTEPKKDVIYIDIEDDITSVIEKVKSAKTSIAALVPPKRIGVLQSVVNLKLLQRAAKSSKKHVVLITNNQALIGLAAELEVPVAKNLQSRPEVPVVEKTSKAAASDEEVIDGKDLPVGEHANTADDAIDLDDISMTSSDKPGAAAAPVSAPFASKAAVKAPRKGSAAAIPDFDKFRKKLFIGIGAGVLLVAFLVWAIVFAPKATVSITARTNVVNINKQLRLTPDAKLDAAQAAASPTVKQMKKAASVTFTPTGKKNVGERATGTVKFENGDTQSPSVIPAGTQVVTSSGLAFVTDSAVTVPPGAANCPTIWTCSGSTGKASVGITAAGPGAKYNGATGTVDGSFDGADAKLTDATSGGTDKTVNVVSQDDVDKAKEQLSAQDSNKVKNELKKQFGDDLIVIGDSFTVEPGEPVSIPAVDAEATSAKLSAETTYTMIAIKRADLRAIFDANIKSQIAGEKAQKIYESGDGNVAFTEFTKNESGFSVRARASGQVGPQIDDQALAKQIVKKRAGEIQQQIETIQGVEDVDVKLSPFWVTKAPGNTEKITIKFVVKND